MIEILRRADDYVIVNKPVGADSEDKGEGSVPALVRESLGVADAYPIHRLDLVVGGAMLLALSKRAAARLTESLVCDSIGKEYICICEGKLDEPCGRMQDMLYFDRAKRKSFVVKKKRNGVKDASLSYELIAERQTSDGRLISMCHVLLDTGRTHQIRVQFASRGHSLLGDGKYGSRDKGCTPALVCRAVTVDGVRTEAPLPTGYPFSLFS